ncbi:MAG: hypothetical protein AABX02_02680 [archaeon]
MPRVRAKPTYRPFAGLKNLLAQREAVEKFKTKVTPTQIREFLTSVHVGEYAGYKITYSKNHPGVVIFVDLKPNHLPGVYGTAHTPHFQTIGNVPVSVVFRPHGLTSERMAFLVKYRGEKPNAAKIRRHEDAHVQTSQTNPALSLKTFHRGPQRTAMRAMGDFILHELISDIAEKSGILSIERFTDREDTINFFTGTYPVPFYSSRRLHELRREAKRVLSKKIRAIVRADRHIPRERLINLLRHATYDTIESTLKAELDRRKKWSRRIPSKR